MERDTFEETAENSYERDYLVGTSRTRKAGMLLLVFGSATLTALSIWLSPGGNAGSQLGTGQTRYETGAVGTSGSRSLATDNSGPDLATISGLASIAGVNDPNKLLGRRLDLQVAIPQHINDIAFWVGSGDNKLLVVLSRDTRSGAQRQWGDPSSSGLGEIQSGQVATISGTVMRVPEAEGMMSWGLTNADRAELMARRIYLRADSIKFPDVAAASNTAPPANPVAATGTSEAAPGKAEKTSGSTSGSTQPR